MNTSAFLDLYPEFSDESVYSPEWIDARIADASFEVKESSWGIHYNRGLAALTAHFLSIRKKEIGNQGTIKHDVSAFTGLDGVKVEYSNRFKRDTKDVLDLTSYGQEYKRLRQIVSYNQNRQTISG